MDRQRAKELLPIIQAFAEGKIVEFRLRDVHHSSAQNNQPQDWTVISDNKAFFLDENEYRIKPEPSEFWIHKQSLNVQAQRPAFDDTGEWIHVREVIE